MTDIKSRPETETKTVRRINRVYTISRIMPSLLSNFFLPSLPKNRYSRIVENRAKATRMVNTLMSTLKGLKNKINPRMRVRFVRHEPMVVPRPNLKWFCFKALNVVESSKIEVLSAMIVAPMTDSGMPSNEAMFDAESITNHELIVRTTRPAIRESILA